MFIWSWSDVHQHVCFGLGSVTSLQMQKCIQLTWHLAKCKCVIPQVCDDGDDGNHHDGRAKNILQPYTPGCTDSSYVFHYF